MPLTHYLGMPDNYLSQYNPIRTRRGSYQDNFNPDFPCIFDRTQEDVDRVKYLRNAILTHTNTEAEWEEYQQDLKGALNYSDLERIETNLGTLAEMLDIELLDMTRDPIPRIPYFKNLQKNVKIIRDSPYHTFTTPETPEMPLNTYQKINDIEKILYDAYWMYLKNEAVKYYAGTDIYAPDNIII